MNQYSDEMFQEIKDFFYKEILFREAFDKKYSLQDCVSHKKCSLLVNVWLAKNFYEDGKAISLDKLEAQAEFWSEILTEEENKKFWEIIDLPLIQKIIYQPL